jgi:signal transduction histidine kinase/PAS domain-containing protein/ActR/RegA family two-component response regulator
MSDPRLRAELSDLHARLEHAIAARNRPEPGSESFQDGSPSPERRLRVLADTTNVLFASLELDETLEQIAHLAVAELGDICIVDLADDTGRLITRAVAHADPEKEPLLRHMRALYPPDLHGPQVQVLHSGHPVLLEQPPADLATSHARSPEHRQLLEKLAIRSYLCVPLHARGRTLGVLTTASNNRAYTREDLLFLEDIALRAATAMDNARLHEELRSRESRLREQQAAIARSEERFRRVQEATPDGFAILRPLRDESGAITDFEYVYANPVTARGLGASQDEIIGRRLRDVFPGIEATPFWDAFRRVAETGIAETYVQPFSGHTFQGWYRNTVVRLDSEIAVTYSDVSAQRRAEESLRFLSEASRVLASSLDYDTTLASVTRLAVPTVADWAAIDMLDDAGGVRRLAVAHIDPKKIELAYEILRRAPLTIEGDGALARVVRTGKPEVIPEISDAMLVAAIADPELLELFRSLGLRSSMVVPLRANGRTVGAITFVSAESGRRFGPDDLRLAEDLARRASAAIENALLYRAASEANRLKDEFLATISHELRTPLTSILGWSRMLVEQSADQARIRKGLITIDRNARAQAQLIEDLLDISRIVSGKLHLAQQAVDLNAVAQGALDIVRPAADARKITLEAELDPDLGSVVGDVDRLQQVVWNLLANAVKFTDAGGRVTIETKRAASQIQIRVVDTGRGISRDFLPFVFERFRQADARVTRQFGGLGLGLAIVRHLVELHGGTVRAESEGEGKGSTFTVTLPIRALLPAAPAEARGNALSEPPPAPMELDVLSGLRILVVDDEPDTRELVSTLLESAGAVTEVAASVAEALSAVGRMRPDAVVTDIGMPGEDGYIFLKRLRAAGQRMPAIALTAYARTEDRKQALGAGFQMHVAKPIEPKKLVAAVARLVGRSDRVTPL